jgi:hypothetical protein
MGTTLLQRSCGERQSKIVPEDPSMPIAHKGRRARWHAAWIATTLLAHSMGAAAQGRQEPVSVIVVEIPPTWPEEDARTLREAIGRELGKVAVVPSDPRAADRSGTIHVRLDPARGELVISYEERPRVISRTVPAPPNRDAMLKAATFLAGNLARNEANDLAWALGQRAPPTTEGSTMPAANPAKRFWFGISGEMDGMIMPAEPNGNICFNTGSYYCTNPDGTDFDLRHPTPGVGGFYVTEGGFDIKNGRLLALAEYAASDNWLLGGRIGFAVQRYPGSLAPKQGFTLGHVHLEGRATYVFGDRPIADVGIAPCVHFALGLAQYDAKENLRDPVWGLRYAWRVYGPAFTSFGVGFRWAIGPDVAAFLAPAKVTFAFPYETTFVWSPEAGAELGF